MRKAIALSYLLAVATAAHTAEAASTSFICKTFTAAKGSIVRTLHEDRPGLFGEVVSVIRVSYLGVNDAGTPEFREASTIYRPVTRETFWKDDGISHRNRIFEIALSESRVLDRTMAARPLSLRVLSVLDNGDLRYRLEPPDGCNH